MCKIEKCALEDAKKIIINKPQWGFVEYLPEVFAKISYDDTGFNVMFTVMEENPKREMKNHFESVHKDSCVELFLNFSPKTSEMYMNFEVNANGAMNVAFRKDRHSKTLLKLEEVESFGIVSKINDNSWTVSYNIGYEFLKSYYPDFDINSCEYIIGNVYKCGDETPIEHYIALFDVNCEKPDFHRPEYFGKFEIVK